MPSLIHEQSDNLIQLVRANHYNFYKEIAENCSIKSGNHGGYKYLMTEQMEWPNMIYDLQLTNDNTIQALENLATVIQSNKVPEFLIIDSAVKNEHFDKSAKLCGFIPIMRWTAMTFQINKTEKIFKLPDDFSISRVNNLKGLKEWISIVNKVLFSREGIMAEVFAPLIYSDKFSFLLGIYKGIPVSTMLVYYMDETAGIYMASTLSDYSGKGFMTAILNFVENEASRCGFKYLTLEANKQSYKLYSSFGFNHVGNFDIYWKNKETK
jgi:ribosomal protein S18 acetylase RimI-like enzyme